MPAEALGAGDGVRHYTARGSVMIFKAVAALDDGDFSLMERTLPPGGRRPPPHRHTNCSEAYFVLDGEVLVVVEDQELTVGPEQFVLVSRGTAHTFGNSSDQQARLLVLHAPAMDAYFAGLHDLWNREVPPTPEEERELMTRFGMQPLYRTLVTAAREGRAVSRAGVTATAPLQRRRGLTEQAAEAAVEQACRSLRLPTVRLQASELIAVAQREQLTYQGFLAELLLAECDDRSRRRSARRVKAAGFPRDKWLADFDYDANASVNPATIHTLGSCQWIRDGKPLCLIGDSGTGKSHLLIGLGTAAAEAGFRVNYILATKLVNELVEAADERVLARTIARYGRVDLLCIDELGYMELDRRGAELLFQVLTEREEKNSVAIASNDSFGGWTKTFPDPRLCAAIVDRLTFGANIIETGTQSYRLAHTRAAQTAATAR